ncbi:hypothetical protein [Oceanirhabdus sp. W0125-5]|uniref:hypothetical protein n=1 Tax=Oceanirhabdus sp. W0125-5 TaxID=2999116 RepID=UPI0022F33CE0|nr:hypothetical protein [Oceanirhabdus sp. W0125-5]WBW99064.1 hypothetical protein OW730_10050 [Oceanirhabdus sp. W0125-5]
MIDFGVIKTYPQEERDRIVKSELPEEKVKLLEKYGLRCNENLYWEKAQYKYKTQEFFSHRLVRRCSVMAIIFHMYRLCIAKINYFERNWTYYTPCKFDWKKGTFVECELFDMECIKQKHTGIVIDLRNLSAIIDINVFRSMCTDLESALDNATNNLAKASTF